MFSLILFKFSRVIDSASSVVNSLYDSSFSTFESILLLTSWLFSLLVQPIINVTILKINIVVLINFPIIKIILQFVFLALQKNNSFIIYTNLNNEKNYLLQIFINCRTRYI